MLVGVQSVKDPISGSEYLTVKYEGTQEELNRLYNKESIEIEVDNGQDNDTEDFYEPSAEEDYKAFVDECAAEIDDLDADDLWDDAYDDDLK